MAEGYMLNILILENLEQEEQMRQIRINQRQLRDNSNPFDLSESQFLKYFRFNKDCVRFLLERIEPFLDEPQRSTSIPTTLQVLVALHFYGHGSYQFAVGQVHILGMSQPSICRCIEKITDILSNHFQAEWIRFPITNAEVTNKKERFVQQFNINGCIGAIDCTHIAIISPPAEHPIYPARAYFNRKGYTSINTQIICDADLNILNINARYPGSTHDSAIWMTSNIKRHLEQKYLNGAENTFLIGDSGYPLQPWLLTPFEGADPGSEEDVYNHIHSSARNSIERLNGVLKSRFRCLLRHRTLNYNPIKAAKIIYSCAILHNISNYFQIQLPDDDAELDDIDQDDDNNLNVVIPDFAHGGRNWHVEGIRIRNNVINHIR